MVSQIEMQDFKKWLSYIVLKMQTYRRIDQQAGVYMLAVTSASGLRLALNIFPQCGIHTGLPAFPCLPEIGDHFRAIADGKEDLAVG